MIFGCEADEYTAAMVLNDTVYIACVIAILEGVLARGSW